MADSLVVVKVDGMRGLAKGLQTTKGNIIKVGKLTTEQTLEAIRDDSKKDAPVGNTARLRDGINIMLDKDGLNGSVGMFDPDVDYAEYVEYGTSKQAQQPFMTPAVEAARKKIPQRLKENAKRVLEQ